MGSRWEWFLSEPLAPFSKRRGDPLGLRDVAEHFADLLASGLTGRTTDARWLTILCWCLKVTNDVTANRGQENYYEWLRPVELLWVARACEFGDAKGRQLPQINSVKEWIRSGSDGKRFGLTGDQWQRYRQTGPYGAYRSLLISLNLMYPNSQLRGEATKLADLVNTAVFHGQPSPTGPIKPDTYWKKWPCDATGKFLPEKRDRTRRLSGGDGPILKRALFDRSEGAWQRKYVVDCLRDLPVNSTEGELVERLASELQKCEFFASRDVALLFPFMELADSAMEVLNQLWRECGNDLATPAGVDIKRAVSVTLVQLVAARRASKNWLRLPNKPVSGVDLKTAKQLAEVLQSTSPSEQLKGLLKHHQSFQRGLPWMKLTGTTVVACSARPQGEASTYRFRLWQLSRIAVQCGVLNTMPKALESTTEQDDDE